MDHNGQQLQDLLTKNRETIIDGTVVDIKTVAPETPRVDRMIATFEKQWTDTAAHCLARAAELESAAAELRQRAVDLHAACNYLHDVKQTSLYEIESREKVQSLMFVNPTNG